jgi:hypothetical protein
MSPFSIVYSLDILADSSVFLAIDVKRRRLSED